MESHPHHMKRLSSHWEQSSLSLAMSFSTGESFGTQIKSALASSTQPTLTRVGLLTIGLMHFGLGQGSATNLMNVQIESPVKSIAGCLLKTLPTSSMTKGNASFPLLPGFVSMSPSRVGVALVVTGSMKDCQCKLPSTANQKMAAKFRMPVMESQAS